MFYNRVMKAIQGLLGLLRLLGLSKQRFQQPSSNSLDNPMITPGIGTSNDARQKLFMQLSRQVRRNVGRKAIELGANAVYIYMYIYIYSTSGVIKCY